MSRKEDFLNRIKCFKDIEEQKKRQCEIIGNLRLAVFLLGIATTILIYIKSESLYWLFSLLLLSLALFIFLVVKHDKAKNELKRATYKVKINNMYIDRIEGSWIKFDDCGQEFIDSSHPYTSDLDIFGSKSLFQWINVSKTYYGRLFLKDLLKNPDKDIESIHKRQRAVKEMTDKLDFCQDLQCESMQAEEIERDPEKLLQYAESSATLFKHEWIINLFYILPAAVILTFILYFLGSSIPVTVPLLLLLAQILIYLIGCRRISLILNTIYDFKNDLEVYKNLLLLIEGEDFEEEYLNNLKKELFHKNEPSSKSIKILEKISDAINLKYSPIIYFILNFTILWDFHCVFALEQWKKQYGAHIRKWLKTIGYFEGISSLAVIQQLYPEWTFPSFTRKDLVFSAIKIGHPLISNDTCICNDIDINNNSCIVTGSNMSGKTTLLRTIGINLVLAYSGAPVYSEKLVCSMMDIFTSMRISDDLNSGISSFYAELLRIKMIIEYSHKKKPMIYLIDEIFRGTNSLDRIIGARSVLKNLCKSWVIGLISTHDFELCDLENEKITNIKNYHFAEKYIGNEIKFDYKLRAGRCKTTNAKYLMKMIGIELIE